MKGLLFCIFWLGVIEIAHAQSSRGRPEQEFESGYILVVVALLFIGYGVVMNLVERFKGRKPGKGGPGEEK